ncbi:MAG: tetratricopeptide repeat protein [Myxococcota bacterium]
MKNASKTTVKNSLDRQGARASDPIARRRAAHFLRIGDRFAVHVVLAILVMLVAGCDRSPSIEGIRALQQEGRYAETIEPLRRLLEQAPDDPETHLLYGTALARTGAARVALWSLRKAAETEPFTVPATLELAAAHSRSGNWGDAIAAAGAVIEIEPRNLPAHLLLGEALLNEGTDPERALEHFDFVLDEEPTTVPALNGRASALLLAGRVEEAAEAIDQLETIVREDQADVATQAGLCAAQAVLRQERGELAEAEARFEECLAQYPVHGGIVDAAITFFDGKGDRARSDALLEKALDLAPESISYRRTLALRAEAAGDSERALAILRAGLETENRELLIAVWTDIANYHLDRDELDDSIAAFEQALELVGDPPEMAVLTHADLLARAGRHEDARRVAKGLENESFAGLIEARIALDQGRPQEALDRLDAVFPVWPNNAGARYYAARAAEQLGDFRRAIEEYRQAIRSSPEQTEAGLRLAKLFLAAGLYEDAWNNAGQYINVHREDPEGARVLVAAASTDTQATLHRLLGQTRGMTIWPAAVAERARIVARQNGPQAALDALAELPDATPDLTSPANAEILRETILLLEAVDRGPEAETIIAAALAAHPENADFLEARAALLEAKGAAPAATRQAFEAVLAQDPRNGRAHAGLGRILERAGETRAALEAYDRATKASPESPEAARRAARLAARSGDAADAERRWIELLKEHPWDAEAAQSLAEYRSARGVHDAVTLDHAERSVLFGGGKPAEALLIRVHEARGEHERAQVLARAFAEGKPIPTRQVDPSSPPGVGDRAATTPPRPDGEAPTTAGPEGG